MRVTKVKFILKAIFGLILCWIPLTEIAQSKPIPEAPGILKIMWNPRDTPMYSDDERLLERELPEWKERCEILGKNFQMGNGPWGTGLFTSFSCWIGDQMVGGQAGDSDWTLRFKEHEENMIYELSRTSPDGETVMSSHEFPKTEFAFTYLRDPEYVDLLSLKIMDGLPASGVIETEKLKSAGAITGRAIFTIETKKVRYGRIDPPKEYNIYELSKAQDSHLVRANLLGKYKFSKKKSKELRWGKVEGLEINSSQKYLWFHSSKGPLQLSKEVDKAMVRAQDELNTAADEGFVSAFIKGARSTASTGYFLGRYGKQVLPGDATVRQSSFVGLLAETRGGPLSGLRILVDIVPITESQSEAGLTKKFGWKRYTLSKAFDLNVDSFIDRIDVVPKVGAMKFDAVLPQDPKDAESDLVEYSFSNLLSLGLEIGMESIGSWYSVRGWYGYDVSSKGFNPSKALVSSHRLGVDALWKVGTLFNVWNIDFKTGLLLFYVYETTSLKKEPDADLADTLNYTAGYAGAGIGISW